MKPLPAARGLALVVAVAALAMVLASGPGTRLGAWSWQTGLALLAGWGRYTAAAAATVAAVLVALAVMPRWRPGVGVALVALCVALAAWVPGTLFRLQAARVPPIHDITTDPADPPAFVALAEARSRAPNGAAYGGPAVAEAQRSAYPDIAPLVLAVPPRKAMQRAIDVARELGWEVAAVDAAGGRLEGTARTPWFGFADDIVVRVRAEGAGSRVDVRSVSRVGRSDVGANAARVRKFVESVAH